MPAPTFPEGLPWPKGGPWRILDDCPAPRHNSLGAGRGVKWLQRNTRVRVAKCVCPFSLLEIEDDKRRRRDRDKEKRREVVTQKYASPKTPIGQSSLTRFRMGAWVPEGVRMPDLSEGACSRPGMAHFMDEAQGAVGKRKAEMEQGARALCRRCTIKPVCHNYVISAEGKTPGAFGGIWAGMNVQERRNLWRATNSGNPRNRAVDI